MDGHTPRCERLRGQWGLQAYPAATIADGRAPQEYERIVKAAVALLSTLGSDDGYFPLAGVTKTRELKNAVKAVGLNVPWGTTP